MLVRVLGALASWLHADAAAVLERWRERDALAGRDISWAGGRGQAAGLDGEGRLLVVRSDGSRTALDAGEVHLGSAPPSSEGAATTVRP